MKASGEGKPQKRRRATGGVRVFDHTADVGLEVWGETLEDLFRWAAVGLYRVALRPSDGAQTPLSGYSSKSSDTSVIMNLGPVPDLESLLVAWLNRLIYLLDAEGRVVISRPTVHTATGPSGGCTLAARAEVRSLPPGRVRAAVKAATLHGLTVARGSRDGHPAHLAHLILDV